ncbi:lactonase family protein [Paenibacillus psychroresistens]|nr:lactonase family protein [Paenibacillus psychroresistens]
MGNTINQQDVYILAGSYSESEQEGIQLLRFNIAEGTIKRVGGIAGVENPAFLAIDPERSRFYAVSEVEEGQIIAFTYDLNSGEIKEVNRQSTQGSSPCHLTVDATGSWLFSVNYSSGSVCLFPIAEDGSIGPIADFKQHTGSSISLDRQQEPHPHSIFSYPDSNYLFVPDLGTDEIYIYSHNALEGKLHLLAAAPATAGAGPRHVDFHPTKPYVYVIQELDSTIAFYTFDEQTKSLSLQQTLSTLPHDFSGESYCADIHISASGSYVYGSNRGDDSVAVFRIAEDGRIEWAGSSSTKGEIPRNFVIMPNGEYLLAANQDSHSIIVLSLGADGIPTPTGESYEMNKPVCLKVI